MSDDLMKAGEVAKLFNVNPKTVLRWCNQHRLPSIRTLGGHRRIPRAAVMALLRGETYEAGQAATPGAGDRPATD